MTRKERYIRAIRMTHRIYQLQDIHGWSNLEAAEALDLIDEELPMHLSSASAWYTRPRRYTCITVY